MYLNKAQVIGNLTRDPEFKSLPSGMKTCSASIATNRTWKDKDGVKQESADFHNIVAFGKTAELIAQYMKKGSQIYVEGRMQTRSWEADGVKKYRTEIVVETMQFGNKPQTSAPARTEQPKVENDENVIEYPTDDINPEDIPF